MNYQLLKIVHLVSVLVWISGMFRLFDYYQNSAESKGERERLLAFDARWTTPAMLLAWLAGVGMAWLVGWWNHRWFIGKFVLVTILSGLHGLLVGRLSREEGLIGLSLRTWWLLLPLFAVVTLVILKP